MAGRKGTRAKKHYNLYLDKCAWEEAQKMFPLKVSSLVNEYLITIVMAKMNSITDIDIELEKLQLNREKDQLNQLRNIIVERQRSIEKYELVNNANEKQVRILI